jgi:acetyltransferase-like isoleucine patch superfamily enzyme
MLLRQIFWPKLFGSCGRKPAFARGIVLRHPGKMHLGDSVIISENCILDARNEQSDRVIVLEDDVILSNNVVLSCKNGTIFLGKGTGINSSAIIQSTNACPVTIAVDGIIGQMSFVVGGGSYNTDRFDIPIREQGIRDDGGVTIRENVWLGANVTVLGGVTIDEGAVVAAGAVVSKSLPSCSIAKGVPAKVCANRKEI